MPGEVTAAQPARRRRIFYYDADCGFCTWTVRWLRKTDWFDTIQWVSFQSLDQPPPGLTWSDLDHAAYLDDTGDGKLFGGFFAFKRLTIRLWPLMPLAPVFWFPGIRFIGVPVYSWVARNRYIISACRLPRSAVDPPAKVRPAADDLRKR